MNDTATQKPLRVSTEGTAGPYIRLPFSQLEDLKRLLDEHRVRYWVDELAISINGSPEYIVINLGRAGDAKAVQAILDSAQ